jgi:hypothetical protein
LTATPEPRSSSAMPRAHMLMLNLALEGNMEGVWRQGAGAGGAGGEHMCGWCASREITQGATDAHQRRVCVVGREGVSK